MIRFPRSARLLSGSDFKRVFAAREARQNRLFRLHRAPLPAEAGAKGPRLGMAVSKRAARRAVDRNRIRRHIRESFRARSSRLAAYDYVVVARSAAADADPATLRGALDQLWLPLENE
ncbi:MAG: ribonuclease P protein component [Wenzhouxiangellaceae bacterium]|nr:ribonuclease P protein component [Wenzhouxiangellaceae bacterium]